MTQPTLFDLPSFHNTIGLKNDELTKADNNAKTQEDRILDFFKTWVKLTPDNVEHLYNRKYAKIPLTSIRRAISNLQIAGKLTKMDKEEDEKALGQYGKPIHYWSIKTINTPV